MIWQLIGRALPYLLVVSVVFAIGGIGYRIGVDGTDAKWQARTNAALADAMGQVAELESKARDAERKSAEAMHTIDNAYQQGRADAQTEYDRTTAERERGDIRLRDRFRCPAANTTGQLSKAGASTSGSDAASAGGLQREDESFLVREAKRADEVAKQLQACQAIVRKDRAEQ